MMPPGLDLGHPVGRFQPLDVPFARLALTGLVSLIGLIPVDDVADNVMHGWSRYLRQWTNL
jgi:hypothetical protein